MSRGQVNSRSMDEIEAEVDPDRGQQAAMAVGQAIARLVLEAVTLRVDGTSEHVEVECDWAGGVRTRHALVRPVRRSSSCAGSTGSWPPSATCLNRTARQPSSQNG